MRYLQIKDVPLRTRRALLPLTLYSNSALLFLNRISLCCNNALLALNWRYLVEKNRLKSWTPSRGLYSFEDAFMKQRPHKNHSSAMLYFQWGHYQFKFFMCKFFSSDSSLNCTWVLSCFPFCLLVLLCSYSNHSYSQSCPAATECLGIQPCDSCNIQRLSNLVSYLTPWHWIFQIL